MTKIMKYSAGLFAFAGIAFSGGQNIAPVSFAEMFQNDSYRINAVFEDVGGLMAGDKVSIAGIPVGWVESVRLKDGLAVVVMDVNDGVPVERDATASIRTVGLMGSKYVCITPGGSETLLTEGDRLRETESAIDVEGLISRQVFGGL